MGMNGQDEQHKFLPGEKVLMRGRKAEVVETYANGSVLIRIGSRTYKSVHPGELDLCGPDGGEPRDPKVHFG